MVLYRIDLWKEKIIKGMYDLIIFIHIFVIIIPSELRASEDFLKCRYNRLDTSARRVIHYTLKRKDFSSH